MQVVCLMAHKKMKTAAIRMNEMLSFQKELSNDDCGRLHNCG
jgi:hypothetical protein